MVAGETPALLLLSEVVAAAAAAATRVLWVLNLSRVAGVHSLHYVAGAVVAGDADGSLLERLLHVYRRGEDHPSGGD